MKKRLLALLLSAALILSLTTPVLAENDPTEPPAEPQQTETVEKCECGLELGHEGECPSAENDDQYDSENNTDTTNEENVNVEGEETPESCVCGLAYEHEGDCQLCECGLVKNHEGDCALCDCGLTKNHEGDCAKCDCGLVKNHKGECDKCNCGLVKNHDGECVPKVGDKIWIKSGSKVYKSMSDTDGHTLILFYHVTIEAIEYDENGAPAWYKFSPAVQWFGAYQYVKVESTTNENPEQPPVDPDQPGDEKKCSCGSEDGVHTEGCPLYKEPEEKPDQGELPEESVMDNLESFVETTDEGVSVVVYAENGAFSDNVSMVVSDTTVDQDTVCDIIAEFESDVEVLAIKAVGISFGEQPNIPVVLSLTIPNDEIPENANKAYIVHFGENGTEVVSSQYLRTDVESHTLLVKVDGFSDYAIVLADATYTSKLLSSALAENDTYGSRYSIDNSFKVDLFDYEPKTFNTSLGEKITGGKNFTFVGYDTDVGSNGGVNDSSSNYAKQGVVQAELKDGLPVFNKVTNGVENAQAFFSDTYALTGKTIYNDKNFEMVYDSETGYYEYKSSANHAQYNNTNGTIELYADTLATYGTDYYPLALNQYVAASAYLSNISATATNFTGTASFSETRIDPNFTLTVPNVPGAEIPYIYLRIKVPKEVGATQLKIYFAGDKCGGITEANHFLHTYTPTGDWETIKLTLSKVARSTDALKAWNESVITQIRIDPFDNVDSYPEPDATVGSVPSGSYAISVADVALTAFSDYPNVGYSSNGGFYPFSSISNAYPSNHPFTLADWQEHMEDSDSAMALASTSIGNPTPTDLTKNLGFGMAMEFDFYIPADKKGEKNSDLTYYFNGDDDLWVFVDGKLVLDIGGGHGAISGTVNFTEGKSVVANAVTIKDYNANDGKAEKKTVTLDSALTSPGKHTMKIFYLERCGSVSNCHMKFNLPRTPEGAVVVKKEVEEVNRLTAAELTELYSKSFTFQITVDNQDENGEELTELSYMLTGEDQPISLVGTAGELGVTFEFALKPNQTATFDIPELHNITVVEIPTPTDFVENKCKYEFKGTTLVVNDNGTVGTKENGPYTTAKDGTIYYTFTNKYEKFQDADLIITKKIVDNVNPDQSFVFRVVGTDFRTTVVIPAEKFVNGIASVTVANLPVGEYTVTEDESWSWRYTLVKTTDTDKGVKAPWAETDTNATFSGSGLTFDFTYLGEEVTFTNERTEDQWLDGEAWAQNIFDGNADQPNVNGERVEVLPPKKEEVPTEQSET